MTLSDSSNEALSALARTITILTWGGLRGGISVALALSLPIGPTRDALVTIIYAVVVFSILVQGRTLNSGAGSRREHADLIVMGAKGLGTIARFLIGSVSTRVVQHANCAVLVVRWQSENHWGVPDGCSCNRVGERRTMAFSVSAAPQLPGEPLKTFQRTY